MTKKHNLQRLGSFFLLLLFAFNANAQDPLQLGSWSDAGGTTSVLFNETFGNAVGTTYSNITNTSGFQSGGSTAYPLTSYFNGTVGISDGYGTLINYTSYTTNTAAHATWVANKRDHTNGSTGYMFVINVVTDIKKALYTARVPINSINPADPNYKPAGSYLFFSFAVMNMIKTTGGNLIKPTIALNVYNSTGGSPTRLWSASTGVVAQDEAWHENGIWVYVPKNVTSMDFELVNLQATAGDGNDLALDDIQVRYSSAPNSNVTNGLALPIIFGDITSIIKNEQLQLNWSTLMENNVDRFEIEASRDGKNFTKIGEVKTKAVNGNSDAEINYSFSKDVTSISSLLGISMLALSIGFFKRRKKIMGLLIVCGILFLFADEGCKKAETPFETTKDGKIFIRIKQIDTNGDYHYSKIIQAVSNE
jgi:hypothetical protein